MRIFEGTNNDPDMLGMSVQMPSDELLRASGSVLAKVGEMVTAALIRKQNQLICEQQGHLDGPPEGYGICSRCHLVTDVALYESQVKGAYT